MAKKKDRESYFCHCVIVKKGGSWEASILNLDGVSATCKSRNEAIKEVMAEGQRHMDDIASRGLVPPLSPPRPLPRDTPFDDQRGFYVYFDRAKAQKAAEEAKA